MWSDLRFKGSKLIYVKLFCFEVKCCEVSYGEVLEDKRSTYSTLVWPYTEGTWRYCDYFFWCAFLYCGCFNLFCCCVNVCVLWCVGVWICVFCNVWLLWQLYGCFVIYILVFTGFRIVCTVFLYCFVYVYYILVLCVLA